jgi:Type IV leader peptidase family
MGSVLSVVAHRVSAGASVVWLAPRKAHPPQGQRFPVFLRGAPGALLPLWGAHPDALPAREVAYGVPLRCRCRSVRGRGPPRLPLTLVAALVALGATDLEHRLLLNTIVSPASLAGLVLSLRGGPAAWWAYPLAALAVAGFLFGLVTVYPGGMGDVKMCRMLGLFLGPYAALAVFVGAFSPRPLPTQCWWPREGSNAEAPRLRDVHGVRGLVTLFAGPQLRGLYLNLVGVA